MITVKVRDSKDIRTERRLHRHGSEYDIVLEHRIDNKPIVKGLLCKSRKTEKYVWFSRERIITVEDKPLGTISVPVIIEGIDTTTPDEQLLNEYFEWKKR